MIKTQINDENSTRKERQLEEGYKLNEAGELIPDYDHTIKYFEDGDIVKGMIVRIDRDEVLVDVGYKSEGVIPLKELSIRKNVDPKEIVQLGSEIETYVLQKEDADGRLILSKKRAEFEKAWERVENAYQNSDVVEGTAIEVVRGGLILDVGVRGFLPASLVDINRVKDLTEFLKQTLECKIIELNRHRNNVVLSRKAVLQGEKQNKKSEILNKITKGQILKGKISSIVDFGAFVDLGGIDGLIHISELSWAHIENPSEVVSVGDEVKVQVLEVDKKKTRVSLSLKQTQENHWKKSIDDLNVGQNYNAKVIRILPFGVFVQFNENLEGLIHVSELSTGRVENPHKYVNVGDEVEVKLINIDEDRSRISLSLKQAKDQLDDEDQGSQEELSSEQAEISEEESIQLEVAEPEQGQETSQQPAEVNKEAEVEVVAEAVETSEEPVSTEVKTAQVTEEVVNKEAKEVVEEAEDAESQVADIEPAVEEKVDDQIEEVQESKKKQEIKIKPAEEKIKKELEKEQKEEDKDKALEALSTGLDNDENSEKSNSDNLEDILEQMKKSHGARD